MITPRSEASVLAKLSTCRPPYWPQPSLRLIPDGHRWTTAPLGLGIPTLTNRTATIGLAAAILAACSLFDPPQPAEHLPTSLAFIQPPSNAIAGIPFAPVIRVVLRDDAGNTVASSVAAVTLTLADPVAGATLDGPATVAAVNGIATFTGLRIKKAAQYRMIASTVVGGSSLSVESTDFTISVAPPSALAVVNPPASEVVAGAPLNAPNVRVQIQDSVGNLITSASQSVAVALIGAAQGTLQGTAAQQASQGEAVFPDLKVFKAGTGYQLQFSATGLANASSPLFAVIPASARRLAVVTQPPTSVAANATLPPVRVAVVDSFSNTVTSDTRIVQLSITPGTGPAGAVLSGTRSRSAADGVASFNDLSIDKEGQYSLTATVSPLGSAVTTLFGVSLSPNTEAGLIARYPMDGNIDDATGNGRHGTLIDSPSFTVGHTGAANGALALNGTTQWATIPGAATPSTTGTLSMWIRMAPTSTKQKCGGNLPDATPFFCHYNLFAKASSTRSFSAQIGGNPTDRFYFLVDAEDIVYTPAASYTWGEWHLYTFTWDATSKAIYMDGQLLLTQPNSQSAPSGVLHLGANGSPEANSHEFLEGAIDDVRIYNRALTASEVAALYTPPPDLVASYPLDATATDVSALANHGSLVGNPTPVPGRTGTPGTALRFGPGQYVTAPASSALQSLTQELTLVFWVRRGDANITQGTIPISRRVGTSIHFLAQAGPGGFASQCCSTDALQSGSVYAPGGSGLAGLNDGNWHQIAHVRRFGSGGFARIFVDGLEVTGSFTSGAAEGIAPSLNAMLFIGRQDSASPGQFIGDIDDVRIYRRALSQAEIIAIQ